VYSPGSGGVDVAMSNGPEASGLRLGTSNMKRKTEQQLWAVAYHEAGHVFAALAYRKGIHINLVYVAFSGPE
jgi:hypothetical protein